MTETPDRADALVWAIDALLMRGRGTAQVRAV